MHTSQDDPDLAIAIEGPRRYRPVRQWGSRYRWLIDSLVAVCYFGCALVLVAVAEIFDTSDDLSNLIFALMLLCATTAAILFRRRWTVPMSVVVLVLSALSAFRGAGADVIAMTIMLFSLTLYRSLRITALFLVLFLALIGATRILPWVTVGTQDEVESVAVLMLSNVLIEFPSLLLLLLSAVSGVLAGVIVRSRRSSRDILVERAEQLEREQGQLAQLAVATERARIAREMHDIVSHTLTVVVTLLDGATMSKDEAASRLAMTGAKDAARGALGDLRHLLGALREEGSAPLAPQPDAHALPELVERFAHAGLPARMVITGTPVEDPAVSLAVHRVIQEGLTNALRYSHRAHRADVSIVYDPDGIDVVVENDGALKNAPSVGTGQGLLGLRERLDLLGGRIETGPVGARVWRLQAWIPLAKETPEGTAS